MRVKCGRWVVLLLGCSSSDLDRVAGMTLGTIPASVIAVEDDEEMVKEGGERPGARDGDPRVKGDDGRSESRGGILFVIESMMTDVGTDGSGKLEALEASLMRKVLFCRRPISSSWWFKGSWQSHISAHRSCPPSRVTYSSLLHPFVLLVDATIRDLIVLETLLLHLGEAFNGLGLF